MPTYTSVVDPGGSGDYTSLAAWEAAEQGLHVAGDIVIADCIRTTAAKDTSRLTIQGWVTGVEPRIIVNATYRHEGYFADTRLSDGNYIYVHRHVGTGVHIDVRQQKVTIDGLTCDNCGTGAYPGTAIQQTNSGNASGIVVKNNVIHNANHGSGGSLAGIYLKSINTMFTNYIYNNVLDGFYNTANAGDAILLSYGKSETSNNTVFGSYRGIRKVAGTHTLKNNLCVNNINSDFAGGFTGASTNNISSDATAVGAIVAINKTAYATYFNDTAAFDFRLKNDSSTLFGLAGADLSATFTTDFEGDARTPSFDIGFDQYVASVSGNFQVVKDLAIQFNMHQNVIAQTDMRWSMLNAITKDVSLQNAILNAVTSNVQLASDLLNSITKDVSLQNAILNAITTDIQLASSLLNTVTNDISLQQNILNAVTVDVQLAWNLLKTTSINLTAQWQLLNVITSDLNMPWSINETINQSVGLVSSLNSSLQTVTKDLTLQFDIRHAIAATLETRFDLLQTINAQTNIAWLLANVVVADLQTQHNILNTVSADADLRWDALELGSDSISLHWSVDGQAFTPTQIMLIKPEQRTHFIKPERRIFAVH